MNDQEPKDQRRIIISAVIGAAVIAGIMWYALFGTTPDTVTDDAFSPTEPAADATIPASDYQAGNQLLENQAQDLNVAQQFSPTTPLPVVIPQIAGETSVAPTVPTGTGKTLLVVALAAMILGLFGWKQAIFTKPN